MSASPADSSFYVYSFDGRLLAEYNLLGQCVRDYIYMGAQLVAEYQPELEKYYYYTSDQINSTRVVTDDTGTVVYSAAHDPYGGSQKTWVNTFAPALKFSGKERDGESGLDYFGARYYDKSQYRFISADPIVMQSGFLIEPHSWNLYAYCGNSPLAFTDRSGQWKSKVHYNVTYQAMLMAFRSWDPSFAASLAQKVASACAAVDSSPSTQSTPSWSFKFVGQAIVPWLEFPDLQQRQKWHFPTSEDLSKAFEIANTTLDPIAFGKALHVIQDSFCHGAFIETASHLWESLKNIFGGRDPDNPLDFWSPAIAMAELTLELCYGYEQRLAK